MTAKEQLEQGLRILEALVSAPAAGLTAAHLSELTGLNRTRIYEQVRPLLDTGLIRHTAGYTSWVRPDGTQQPVGCRWYQATDAGRQVAAARQLPPAAKFKRPPWYDGSPEAVARVRPADATVIQGRTRLRYWDAECPRCGALCLYRDGPAVALLASVSIRPGTVVPIPHVCKREEHQ